jgi:RNA polymerase sigma-70 factor (ECF subfamily)
MWTREQIAQLYSEHGFGVLRRCRRLLGDDAEAKDMVQEVFVRALENPSAFQGRSAASTYLYGVATHLCLNRIRNRLARSEAWEAALAIGLKARAATEPSETLHCQQLVSLLLAEADETTAAIALYHWVDGLTQGEIAKLVGLSRVTVNQRLVRLRAEAIALSGKS